MKLSHRGEEKATTSGGASLGRYRIAQSRAAFETMSSRLYSDKIRAVLRELACNAWDAHQDAGKVDVPFEIHLPTDFEPYFEIKDYGTGMSHRDIVDLFCTYFGTNKSDSDKFIGALGLGSKSPFCLTIRNAKSGKEEPQGFTVIDRYKGDSGICPVCKKITLLREDGKISQKLAWDKIYGDDSNILPEEKGTHVCEGVGQDAVRIPFTTRIYDALVEEGEPGIRLSAEMETPEEVLGLGVKFDVPQNSVWEYENKAKIVFPFFDPLPIINIEGFPLQNPRKTEKFYSVQTERWGMRTTPATPQGSTVRAIQGNVPYSVGHIDISRTSDYQKKLLMMPIDLWFPIGSLDPAVSRETLELNDRTIENILKMLDEVFTGLMEEVRKTINACPSSWEARIKIFELSHSEGLGKLVNDAWNTGKLFGKYDNFSLDAKKPTINDLDYEGIQVTRFAHNWKSNAKRAEKGTVFSVLDGYARQTAMNEIVNGSITKMSYDRQVEVEPSVQFVINDLKVGGDRYIHYFIQSAADNQGEGDDAKGKKKKVYVIGRANRHVEIKQVIKQGKKLLKNLGNPSMRLLSEIKAKYSPLIDLRNTNPRVPVERRTIVTLKDEIDSYRRGPNWSKAWNRSDEQPEGVKYYVTIDRYRALESGFGTANNLLRFMNHVRRSGYFGLTTDTPLYGLRTKSKLRKKTTEWVELVPHVMNMVREIMTPAKELSLTTMLHPFDCDYENLLEKVAEEKPLSPFSPLQQFAEQLALVNQPRSKADEALNDVLEEAQKRSFYSINNTIDFDEIWKGVIVKYPMLTLDYYHRDSESTRELILDYVALMDERAGVAPKTKAAAAAAQEASNE
jgi:hypothetical protein